MAKRNKDPLAGWTGPQIDRDSIESVLNSYFEGANNEAAGAATASRVNSQESESQKNHKLQADKQSIEKEIGGLTGSMTGSINRSANPADIQSVYLRLDATHTTSESVLYSVMYRETHSKGIRTRRFSIPELMRLSGIRSKNTVRRVLAGLKEKLSIREIEPAQATLPPLYEIKKIREIFTDRSAAGIKIDDRKAVFHRTRSLTGSKIDPLTGSKIDPLLKEEEKIIREEYPASPAVEISGKQIEEESTASPFIRIFETVLNRGLTDNERQRVITETVEILQGWATAKSLHASEPIREVTYLINGLRQALAPKQEAKQIEPEKLRRWIIRLLKEKWPTVKQREEVEIGEAAEYIKQSLANHRINYNPHVSIISDVIGEWYQGAFDHKA